MPYIAMDARERLDPSIDAVVLPATPGELNYLVTRLIDRSLTDGGLRYSALNEVIGALECVKLELYRRVAAPYEDAKAVEHGDVYRCAPESPVT